METRLIWPGQYGQSGNLDGSPRHRAREVHRAAVFGFLLQIATSVPAAGIRVKAAASIKRRKVCFRCGLAGLSILFCFIAAPGAAQAGPACAAGTYRLGDGSIVDVTRSDASHWRWRRTDGSTGLLSHKPGSAWTSSLGWTGHPDGHRVGFSCRPHWLLFDRLSGAPARLRIRNIRFQVEGATLAGRLVMPEGKTKVPVVVLVHGAEHDSALDSYPLQRLFPAAGIGTFVYDKRGTGASGGHYTQDYPTLAADAIAALKEARRLAGARAGRIGYQGGSQGGWVAPLAAKRGPADFVIVSFGLAVSPLAAERESIEHEIESRIPGPDGIEAAHEFAAAIERVASSNFRDGFDQIAAIRHRYGAEPWFKQVGGDFARFLLDSPADMVRKAGPPLINGIKLDYDPMPVLRTLAVPQLWLLGGKDRDTAPYETTTRLTQLRCAGRPITLVVYPNAEHGMYEFAVGPNGERVSTRQPKSYFRLMRDFIMKGRIAEREARDAYFPSCH